MKTCLIIFSLKAEINLKLIFLSVKGKSVSFDHSHKKQKDFACDVSCDYALMKADLCRLLISSLLGCLCFFKEFL